MTNAPKWTSEQVLALAPDAGSAKAGRELGVPRKWQRLNSHEQIIWGECQGSAKDPYRCIIDLSEPAFACTCPSRKFPCKHSLGLFLNWAQQSNLFKADSPPEWVTTWLVGRTKRAQAKAERAEKQREEIADPEAQAKRVAAREQKVEAGLQELERWLHDLVRGGLAQAATREQTYWSNMAARLIDAQAPGLANRVGDLAGLHATGEGWQSRLLERLARLHLVIEGYKRIDTLPETMQSDLRTLIGWTHDKEDLLRQTGVQDQWLVLGQRVVDEDGLLARGPLRTQRTWLMGQQSQQPALLLSFAVGAQAFDVALGVGSCIQAELVFYPSHFPLRAILKQRGEASAVAQPLGYADLQSALVAYGQAHARYPWLQQFPILLNEVRVVRQEGQCCVCDQQQRKHGDPSGLCERVATFSNQRRTSDHAVWRMGW